MNLQPFLPFLLVAGIGSVTPPNRYAHCAVRVPNSFIYEMFIYGGRATRADDTSTVQVYGDVWGLTRRASWWLLEQLDPSPPSRSNMACAADPALDSFYIYGGLSADARALDDVWHFRLVDPRVESWTWVELIDRRRPPPLPRVDAVMLAVNVSSETELFILGGCDRSRARGDSWSFAVAELRWVRIPFGSDEQVEAALLPGEPPPLLPQPPSPPPPALSPPPQSSAAAADVEPRWTVPRPRCAASAVLDAQGDAIYMFGGRSPVAVRRDDGSIEHMWAASDELWKLSVRNLARYLRGEYGANEQTTPGRALWTLIELPARADSRADDSDESPFLKRSDGAACLVGRELIVFGGIYADTSARAVFVMRDGFSVTLGDGEQLGVARLPFAPSWRFGAAMAPGSDGESLVLHGGAAGDQAYGDAWRFSTVARTWTRLVLEPPRAFPAHYVIALLGGATLALAALSCLTLCYAYRHVLLVQRARLLQRPPAAQPTRAAADSAIERLPVLLWRDAKLEASKPAPAPAPARAPAAQPPQLPEGGAGASAEPREPHAAREPLGLLALVHERSSDASPREQSVPASSPTRSPRANLDRPGFGGLLARLASSGSLSRGAAAVPDEPAESDAEAEAERALDASPACAICLAEFEDDEAVCRLPCRHVFHKACIHRWLGRDASCPQCRARIGDDDDEPPAPDSAQGDAPPSPARASGASAASPRHARRRLQLARRRPPRDASLDAVVVELTELTPGRRRGDATGEGARGVELAGRHAASSTR